jgi:HD-GYP domain-containing protein (c-di-GMP phosphodiesterase class II)
MKELFKTLSSAYDHVLETYESTLSIFAKAVDMRSREDEGHTCRLADMTAALGSAAGLDDHDVLLARWGAFLHDIGTIFIPENILLKTGGLTDEEWNVIRTHPLRAHELLSAAPSLRSVMDIPYCHHEKWDGTGYPRGLTGAKIPLPARIFAVVDVYDALLSERPYREPWPEEMVRSHIRNLAGIHFDPEVVQYFFGLLE